MRRLTINICCLLLLVVMPPLCYSGEEEDLQTDAWKMHQITAVSASGLMKRSGGDPYIVFPSMEATSYTIRGVEMEIAFRPMPEKPLLMELFWRPDYEGFSEHRKVFFVLLPAKNGDTLKFVIPLDNQAGYKQFRLDFPRDIKTSFQVKSFRPVTGDQIPGDVERIEPFYKLTVTETRTPGVIIPYILHAIQHGLSRLLKDPAFLVIWLSLILAVLICTRIISRSIGKQQEEIPDNDSGNISELGN